MARIKIAGKEYKINETTGNMKKAWKAELELTKFFKRESETKDIDDPVEATEEMMNSEIAMMDFSEKYIVDMINDKDLTVTGLEKNFMVDENDDLNVSAKLGSIVRQIQDAIFHNKPETAKNVKADSKPEVTTTTTKKSTTKNVSKKSSTKSKS